MRNLPDCPDCRVPAGQRHTVECDVAVCLETGGQRLLHQMPVDVTAALIGDFPQAQPGHDCGEDVWTGDRHGNDVCREAGWWVRRPGPGEAGLGWIPCPAGTPGAALDRNRLHVSAAWSPAARRWVRLDNLLAA